MVLNAVSRALLVGIASAATALSTAPDGRAAEAGNGTSADVQVRCAQERGEMLGPCTVAAWRVTNGTTRLTIAFPNGFARTLLFENGRFVRANPTMSGVGTDVDWRVEDERHIIRVEDQLYEVPVALVGDG